MCCLDKAIARHIWQNLWRGVALIQRIAQAMHLYIEHESIEHSTMEHVKYTFFRRGAYDEASAAAKVCVDKLH